MPDFAIKLEKKKNSPNFYVDQPNFVNPTTPPLNSRKLPEYKNPLILLPRVKDVKQVVVVMMFPRMLRNLELMLPFAIQEQVLSE